jgi:hypothetical protein
MTNPFKKIFLFIINFSLFTGIGLTLYYQLKESPFKREVKKLDLTHIARICPESPNKFLFQECLRPKISSLTKLATPMEVLAIPDLLESYYHQDQIQGEKFSVPSTIAYIFNQVIFYESLTHFSIRRDSLDFFQIIMLPIFRWQLGGELKETQEKMDEDLSQLKSAELTEIEKRYIERFQKLSIESI